ncbi:TPR domain-containing protein [Vibrio scophthalmi]|uniref:Putative formate-dependent nitrite reductase complex NrfG subunit n=1 Tax=Vibrio scophthalmi LMG 19158 TaxID=870967 RepID=F9RTU6_9VIBR|nr:nitrite reductase [Vibrio scophthalmi]EGU30791.1 putative formate-dependent nitrite reductase complex NrfG subunit [Vibrio scophthalmi LMG 19158]
MKKMILASILVSVPLFVWLRGSPPPNALLEQSAFSHQQQMSDLQTQLKADPNQADLWFQLGHGYLNQQEFTAALTCFDYAMRLSDTPSASQLSAKASALYYQNKQQMSAEVKGLLNQSLALEADNLTALTLLASDHFISFRYQPAIEIWTQILDSQHPDVDRITIIQLLNQAKQMQAGQ